MIKIKVCGITNKEDALNAVKFGVDALGFVFYEDSPRYVKKETVKDICDSLPPFISTVGVFVNEDVKKIKVITKYCNLDIVQLHGDEPNEIFSEIPKKIIKAIRVSPSQKDAESLLSKIHEYNLDTVLIDTFKKDSYGGTGESFNWDVAARIARETRLILSGGLNCENVLTAVKHVIPYAVDVSSGVEDKEGKKDILKLKRFMELVKSSTW